MADNSNGDGGDFDGDDQLNLPIQSGVRLRRTGQSTSRRNGRMLAQQQERHMIGGEVVRSMKRGLATRRGETRTKVLLYLAIGMFALLSTYWLVRINRKTGIIPLPL